MNTIFISHSSKDEAKARNLKKFLEYVLDEYPDFTRQDYDIFFAPDSLPKIDDGKIWKTQLNIELDKTTRFISLVSPNSIYSRWSNYEFGYVSALKNVKIIPISNFEHFDVDKPILGYLPSSVIRSLANNDINDVISDVCTFLIKVFGHYKDETDEQNKAIKMLSSWFLDNGWFDLLDHDEIDKFNPNDRINKLKEFVNIQSHRTIYVVGSRTKNKPLSDYDWNRENIANFVSLLSRKFLKEGLTLASSPRVPDVGEVVARASITGDNQYKIIGLYKIEQALPKSKLSEEEKKTWGNAITRHRLDYLDNVDVYVIIGGNKNTRDEYNAARTKNHLIIIPLPCFGGVSKEVFDMHQKELSELYKSIKYPCCKCEFNGCKEFKGCPHIDQIVKLIETFVIVEWKKLELH